MTKPDVAAPRERGELGGGAASEVGRRQRCATDGQRRNHPAQTGVQIGDLRCDGGTTVTVLEVPLDLGVLAF